jgi:hypothetical protein
MLLLFVNFSRLRIRRPHTIQAIARASQSHLEKTMLKVIEAQESYPLPGRSLRKLVSRCLVLIYTRGETRTLFDTLQRLIKLVGDFKPSSPQDIIKTCLRYDFHVYRRCLIIYFTEQLSTVSENSCYLLDHRCVITELCTCVL